MPASTEPPTIYDNITAVTRILMAFRGGMTQSDLARLMGVDKAVISKSFKGFRPWKIEDVEALADVFDVPITRFFEPPEDVLRSRCVSAPDVVIAPGYEQLSLTVAA